MSKDYLEKELPLEAKRRFIFISLVIAFIVNLFPLQEIIFLLRPDFVALTLLFLEYQPAPPSRNECGFYFRDYHGCMQ